MHYEPTVFLVDDDPAMRESLSWLLRTDGLHVEEYGTIDELLSAYDAETPGCLVLDFKLPKSTGLDLYCRLRKSGCRHPFLMISGHGDVSTAVQAMRLGAVDFLEKPFERQTFLDRVREAIAEDQQRRQQDGDRQEVQRLIDTLTPRQREVLDLVVDGQLTKQIASKLNISAKTVEVHRSHITKKMRVNSVAQLVRMVTTNSTEPAVH